MLEEKDIQKIGEEVGKVIEQNIIPVLDELKTDIAGLKTDGAGLKTDVAGLKTDGAGLKTDVAGLKTDVAKIRSEMVTKSYLDDKLADLEGNLITKLRKEDGKVNRLIDVLRDKSVLTDQDVEQFKEFQIFPRI